MMDGLEAGIRALNGKEKPLEGSIVEWDTGYFSEENLMEAEVNVYWRRAGVRGGRERKGIGEVRAYSISLHSCLYCEASGIIPRSLVRFKV
jgi:hypothetical protein